MAEGDSDRDDGERLCAYCGKLGGNFVAIGRPGRLDVINDFVHAKCERGYLRLLDDPESRR